MGALIGILCAVVILGRYSLLNSFLYVVHRKSCLKINRAICTQGPRLVFACLKLYAHFKFEPDYSCVNDLPDQFLIICNHQSLLDIVVFYGYKKGWPVRFVAKNALGGHVPLVSVMLKTDQHCIIDKNAGASQMMQTLDAFSDRIIKNNWIPLIFPEGTRSKDGKIGRFHAAGFRRLTEKVQLPVVAFALDGGWNIRNLSKIIKNLHDGSYKIKALKVYDAPKTKQDQLAILEDAHKRISEQLVQWRS